MTSLSRRLPGQRSISFGLWVVSALLSASWAWAEAIWRGDFETGTTEQWRGAPKGEHIKIVEAPVRAGKFALRIEGSNAARRGELDRIEFQHQPAGNGTAEGTERYFGWSVFLPKKLTGGLHSTGYFETRNSWTRLMAFDVHGEDILFTTRVPYARRWDGKGKLTPGRWHDFAVHVLWSRDPAKGFVEVWFNGELVVPRVNTATLRDENPAFFQIGFFRATSDVPETIIIDHIIEATTLAEVTPPPLADKGKPAAAFPETSGRGGILKTVNVIGFERRALAGFDGKVSSSSTSAPTPHKHHDETLPREDSMTEHFCSTCGPYRGQPKLRTE